MISKNQMKYVRSLETKKGRAKEGAFVAEGPKVVGDLFAVMQPLMVVATEEWFAVSGRTVGDRDAVVTADELRRVSFLQHPQQVLAVFPTGSGVCGSMASGAIGSGVEALDEAGLYLALDGVQDPGNLGTIIRIADWFGISRIFCSRDTADVYNPKVVQATMGSIARVRVEYVGLEELFASLPEGFPIYGTFLDGTDIYREKLTAHGVIVMGNEGKGVSPRVGSLVNRRLLIPNFPEGRETADSLNVAIATAICCSEFRRTLNKN